MTAPSTTPAAWEEKAEEYAENAYTRDMHVTVVLKSAFLAGMRAGAEEERSRFRVWGSDACRTCDDGRFTLFSLGACIECRNRALQPDEGDK